MRVLADYHHSDLFESLQILFEDRFGWQLFAPCGMQWFDSWYWNFEREWHGDAVARQYLEGVWPQAVDKGDHLEQADRTHPGRILKGVTLEQARSQSWDLIIASLTANERGFAKLAAETGAKFGVQVGNVGQAQRVEWEAVDCGLISSTLDGMLPPKPHVIYRQEFSLSDFRFDYPPLEQRSVASFIQCFAENKGFYDDFLTLARGNPDFDWKVYGAYGSHEPDEFACGNLDSTPAVAAAMRQTRIAWHAKWWSDGFGHVIHNLCASGKPIVGPLAYYADKLAGPLLIDGVTCFDTGHRSMQETVGILRQLRDDDDYHARVSVAMAMGFKQVVDFDAEAHSVRAMLEGVL